MTALTAPAAMVHLRVPSTVPQAASSEQATAPVSALLKISTTSPALSMDFYEEVGSAAFSTNMGHYEHRPLRKPYPLPVVRSNINLDVAAKAEALEREFPAICRVIREPKKWADLHRYFDGHDLYVEGADFCWYVITQIGKRNAYMKKLSDNEIDHYARDWVMYHGEKVLHLPEVTDLTALFNDEEEEGLKDLTKSQLDLLKAKLIIHRNSLLKQQCERGLLGVQLRSVPQLYPVTEGLPMPRGLPTVQSRDLHRPGSGRVDSYSLQPLFPQPHTPYSEFMNTQSRRIVTNPAEWLNRQRGLSDTSRYIPPGEPNHKPKVPGSMTFAEILTQPGARTNDSGRRTVSNTPKGTPPRHEPVYVYKPNHSSPPPPQFPTQSGTFPKGRRLMEGINMHAGQMPWTDIPFRGHPSAYISNTGASTFYYVGTPKKTTSDENTTRTVYVGPLDRETFASHELQQIMSICGEVESIHYPTADRAGIGPAFVTFMHEKSVGKAISNFDQTKLAGDFVYVNRPRARGSERYNGSVRQRSCSNRQMFRAPRTFEECRPRRHSIRQSNNEFDLPMKPDSAVDIESPGSEMKLQHAAVDKIPMPLSSTENLPPKSQMQSGAQTSGASRQKDNSPMEQSRASTPVTTTEKSNEGHQSSRDGESKSKKGRGNKENLEDQSTSCPNSSTLPTPASTPVKSLSQVKLSVMAGDISHQMQGITIAQSSVTPAESTKVKDASFQAHKPKKSKNKRKSSSTASIAESVAVTDVSEILQSPIETETSGSFTVTSTSTSYSSLYSRKQSLVPTSSDTGLALEASRLTSKGDSPPKKRSTPRKGRKTVAHHGQPEKENNVTSQVQPAKGTNDSGSLNEMEQQSQPKKHVRGSAHTKQKDARKHADKSLPTDSEKKDNDHRDTEQQPQPKRSIQEKPQAKKSVQENMERKCRELADLKENNKPRTKATKEQTMIPVSQQKVDTKSLRIGRSGRTTFQSEADPQNVLEKTPQPEPSLNPNFEDPGQWPALGPSSSPQSLIADGKRPPPLPTPAVRAPTVQCKNVKLAVPVISKTPQPQP